MRHLASIQKIWKIEPIEGADRIELIHVCGWQCVANKGQFKEMDNAIYFEIDSFLPIRPEFEFLRSSSYKKTDIMGEGFRLRTMRFKGQISQGLVLPLSVFPELDPNIEVGVDVSQVLGVKKWEVEERATTQGTIIGPLPPTVPHSDETRCFTGRTKITTDHGLVDIASIVNNKLNYKVLTYNLTTNTCEWSEIANYYKFTEIEPLCKIVYPFKYNENRVNTLTGTLEHKIFTQRGWTKMSDVQIGDTLYLPSIAYDNNVIPIIAGMLLGDSNMSAERRTSLDGSIYKKRRILFCQGEKQIDYLKEKMRILGCDKPLRHSKSGYNTTHTVYQQTLSIDDTIESWLTDMFGNDKHMTITDKFADCLTPISFAFWYMDDGSIHRSKSCQPQIALSTHAYSFEENQILSRRLKDFGIDAKIYTTHKDNKEYYYLHLNVESAKRFQAIIAKYICPTMRYKLAEEYLQEPYVLNDYVINKTTKLFEVPVLDKIITYPSKYVHRMYVYNIETKNNHNYFANRILVHNCQAEPELIQDFGDLEYYISTKMDGSSHSVALDEDGWHVCGHNYEYADDGKSSFYNFINNLGLREKMEKYVKEMGYKTLVIQGEFCAPGIQKNPLKLAKPEWYVFTIRVDDKRVGLIPMQTICHELGLNHVPIEEVADNLSAHYPTVEALLARAEQGTYPSGSMKEGIVIRPTEPVYCPRISASLSMKVVSNKYLLKKGE